MNRKIPVTIFTGFLGSGKTTIISNLLKQFRDLNIAVLVNEFGEVSIDGQILSKHEQQPGITVIPLNTPLAGYQTDDELDNVLATLASHRPRYDHILIETSGLAVPTGIIEKLQGISRENFVLDATLTVIDVPWLLEKPFADPGSDHGKSTAEVFRRQLDTADVIVLNKIDRLHHDALHNAEHELREWSPNARFVELASHGQLNPKVAIGLRLNEVVASTHAQELVASLAHQHGDGHDHSGLGEHEHGVHTHEHIHEHDPGWISFALHCHGALQPERVQEALHRLSQIEALMRFKGAVSTPDGHSLMVHGVRDRVTVEPSSSHQHDSQIVFIGYHLNRSQVALVMNDSTGGHWH